jgi:UDP-N-acetylmuramate--alanine ligase
VLVVSDYAHHPSEITALLAAARGLGRRRTLAVFQPHRYTRTLALREEFPPAFDGVDKLVLTPVYEASESPLAGGTTEDLAQAFRARGGVLPQVVESLEEAWEFLRNDLEEGDLLLVVGAGDVERIGAWAREELAG